MIQIYQKEKEIAKLKPKWRTIHKFLNTIIGANTNMNFFKRRVEISLKATHLKINWLDIKKFFYCISEGFSVDVSSLVLLYKNINLYNIKIKQKNIRKINKKKQISMMIGKNGKVKRYLENKTNTKIKFQKKAVLIIGTTKNFNIVKKRLSAI